MTVIGVTGASGNLGSRIARNLADAGQPAILLPHRPETAAGLPSVEVRACDYAAPEDSLAGIEVLFMVSARESADRAAEQRALIDAAVRAGVGFIVYTSFEGAGPEATFTFARTHGETEAYLRASGVEWAFLRDNFYLDVLAAFADDQGVIRGPAGQGRVAAVARADVADVATAVLLDPARYRNATLRLSGPEALSFDDVARVATQVTGRQIRYHAETLDEAYASRAAFDPEPWQLDGWVSTYTAIASGELATVTGDVEAVLSRPPLSLEQVLRAE